MMQKEDVGGTTIPPKAAGNSHEHVTSLWPVDVCAMISHGHCLARSLVPVSRSGDPGIRATPMAQNSSAPVEHSVFSYLCRMQVETLAIPEAQKLPWQRRFPGAILLFDIAGFTELTEKFALGGAEGAEQLSGVLNAHFGPMTEIIMSYGGDVLSFAGDSVLAVWASPSPEELGRAACLSAQAALSVQKTLRGHELAGGVILRQRAGVGAGWLSAINVGGREERWQFLVVGKPILRAGQANQEAASGDVVFTPDAWRTVQHDCQGVTLPSGSVRLDAVVSAVAPQLHDHDSPRALAIAARDNIPQVVWDRLQAGQGAWLAEFRTVTVIFMNLAGIDLEQRDLLTQLQPAATTMQDIVFRYEGTIYQFLMDEKGITMVSAFGLPPLAHENDAMRGAEAALTLHKELGQLACPVSVGVTTGQVFCGVYGSNERRQYTLVGPAMNLAARLMQVADHQVLCDRATSLAARASRLLDFEGLPALSVKGRSMAVEVHRPGWKTRGSSAVPPNIADQAAAQAEPDEIVGRNAERAALGDALEALLRGESGAVVIEGEAGIGKSRLVEHLLHEAGRRNVRCLAVAGDAIEKSTPYYGWRPVFRELLGVDSAPETAEGRRQHVLRQLHADPEASLLAPLLNTILSLDFPDNELTAQMGEEGRAESTRKLLLGLLRQADGNRPRALVVEDAHWLDSASWKLATLSSQSLRPLLLIVATRPLAEPMAEEYQALFELPGSRHLILDALPPEDTLSLVCRRLGVQSLPREIGQFIQERAAGQPLFSEEVTFALRDAGLIQVVDGSCRLSPAVFSSSRDPKEHFSALDFPRTVQGVITSRIDRLPQPQQLALKVGSVIGRAFSVSTLRDIYPLEADREHLPDFLRELERLGIAHRGRQAEETYTFKHSLIQDVVYNSVPYAHRRELHRAVAEWYERSGDLPPHYPLLAHHWRRAEVLPKAIEYSAAAGELALHNFANQEAVQFFTQALEWDGEHRSAGAPGSTHLRRAQWEMQLGKAYTNTTRYAEGRQHLEQGLSLRRRRVPRSTLSAAGALFREMGKQALHRTWPRHYTGRRSARREEFLEFARAYEALTEIYYLVDKPAHCLYAVFRSLNLAEEAGLSPELARCYSSTGALLGFLSLHKSAQAYCRRATEVAEQVDDAGAHAWVGIAKGLYWAGLGEWQKAEKALCQSISINDRLGDRRRGDDGRITMAEMRYFQGNFVDSLNWAEQARVSAEQRRDLRLLAEAARMRAYGLLALNRLDEVLDCLANLYSLRAVLAGAGGTHRKEYVQALYGVLHLRRGELSKAREAADIAAAALTHQSNNAFDFLAELWTVAQTYLGLWEAGRGVAETSGAGQIDVASAAHKACKKLRGYARVFPIGKPASELCMGQLEWLKGNRRRAQMMWQKSLAAAEKLGMRHAEGLSHDEIGRHLPRHDSARHQHLIQAAEIFRGLAAAYDLARVEQIEPDSRV